MARVDGQGLRVVGIGHQPAQGMRSGNIVDMEAADARHLLGGVDRGGDVRRARPRGHRRRERRLGRLAQPEPRRARSATTRSASATCAACSSTSTCRPRPPTATSSIPRPIGFSVDGTAGARRRAACSASAWASTSTWSTAASGAMRNLQVCVRRAHLEIADRVVAAHAAGLSSLVADERDLGVTLIDMGGGTTSIAVFYEGHLVHVDSIPVGGEHVTRDIARGLSTPLAHAERMKTPDRPRRRQAQRRVRHHRRAADRRGGSHPAQPHPALDPGRHHPAAHRGDVRAGAQPTRGQRCG